MKLTTIIFFAFLAFSNGLYAQDADQRISSLLNQNDWFALEEEYPKEKDKIQSIAVKGISEVMLDMNFNKPERALVLIDSLLTHCQEQLGFGNVCSMVVFKSQALGNLGRYAESADNLNNFLNQITAFAKKEDFPSHVFLAKYYDEIRNEQKMDISRPDKDVEVSMHIKSAGKGVLMFVPVMIRGKIYQFIFDTGASFTCVSERLANEIGLRIVSDSTLIRGLGTGIGKRGTIDSLMVGNITVKHPIITIMPPDITVDTVYQVDAVLGLDFIKLVGEIHIFPKEKRILFPQSQALLPQTGKNLCIESDQPYLKTYSGKERLIFHFDTGNVMAELYTPYYQKYKSHIETYGTKDSIRRGGFGGIKITEGYVLPQVSLKIGTTNFELNNIAVSTETLGDFQRNEDGVLGMDFISLFRKIVINFNEMFVEVEK